jgi:hypothetical protein
MNLAEKLRNPGIEYWPDVRWWLAEGFHTDETLKKDIGMLYEKGFGAAEFLAMDERGIDHGKYGWGSEEWVHDTHTMIRETTARGMGASMTSGTNWSNANLITIKPDDKAAAKELNYTVESLKGGQSRSGPLQKAGIKMPNVHAQELIAVVAVKKTGAEKGKTFLDKRSAQVLTDKVRGENLDWTAPVGSEWELFSFWMHGTGQTASPSCAVSYTVNYIDRYGIDALIDYWNREVLTPELRGCIAKNKRVQMYMDSLELFCYGKGGQFWGYHFLEEFAKRRGYDLTPYLPFIVKKEIMMGGPGTYPYYYEADAGDPEAVLFVRKLRNDVYQTMTDLYIANMLRPMREWLHSVGMTLRAEISYGLPFEISIPGKYVDGIETESLEFSSQIEPFRNLAGPAHLYGKLYSSETGATMMNYRMGLDFYTQIIYTQFAAGVARTVFHGYSSIAGSEAATYWPGHEGMLPLFSERFGSRQPAYQHYNEWTAMIARYQYLLRQGKPRIDVGILRLDYNFNNMYNMGGGTGEQEGYEKGGMRANKGVYWQDSALQNTGYTWDYFAPQILEDESITFAGGLIAPDGPGYQALIVYQEEMPLSSAKRILAWAKQGLKVILVNGVTEQIRPAASKTHDRAASITPYNSESDAELAAVMGELKALPTVREIDEQSKTVETLRSFGVLPRAAFKEPNKNILTAMREDGGNRYVFVYNMLYTEKAPCVFELRVEGEGAPYRIDCWTGSVNALDNCAIRDGRTTVPLTLMPGEAAIITLNTEEKPPEARSAPDCDFSPVRVNIEEWDLTVEDWNEGGRKEIIEDRGLGLVTKEVYYETKKTPVKAGRTTLKPWKDIPGIGPEVSGVGYYTGSFTAPETWKIGSAVILRLGGTHGNSAAVYVNGKKAPPYDFNRKALDISSLIKQCENSITVEVSSTLNNRLKARGYHVEIEKMLQSMAANFPAPEPGEEGSDMDLLAGGILQAANPPVEDYGLEGPVTVEFAV